VHLKKGLREKAFRMIRFANKGGPELRGMETTGPQSKTERLYREKGSAHTHDREKNQSVGRTYKRGQEQEGEGKPGTGGS